MFNDIWCRIKSSTEIRQLKELADAVGTIQSTVSRKRKEDQFPVEWAYLVAKKYSLSTDWIIEGKGPKKLTCLTQKSNENSYTAKLAEWMAEEEKEDVRRRGEIELQIERALPEFKEWLDAKKKPEAKAA